MWRSFVCCSFLCYCIFRLFSIFSLSLFTWTLSFRSCLSFFFVFFLFITKIERNFTLYMLKKKKENFYYKREKTVVFYRLFISLFIEYTKFIVDINFIQPWPNFQILTLSRLPSIRLNTRPPRLQLRTTILRHRNVSSTGVGKSVLHVEKKGEPAGADPWWPVSRRERHNFAWHGRRGGRDYRFIDLIFPTGPVVEVSAFIGRQVEQTK